MGIAIRQSSGNLAWLLSILLLGVAPMAYAAESPRKVLVVVSSADSLTLQGGKKHPTGFFLNELGVPVKALIDAGYEPVFADPLGNKPAMDEISDNPSYFGKDEKKYAMIKSLVTELPGLKHPLPLEKVAAGDLKQYAAVFIPGGHAPMEDLWKQPALGRILHHFHDLHKPTALICHGPIALLSSLTDPQRLVSALEQGKNVQAEKMPWIYAGYQITVFSDAEEKPTDVPTWLGGKMRFFPEDALRAAGAKVTEAPPGQSNVVNDRELITGQNPQSDEELAAQLLNALKH